MATRTVQRGTQRGTRQSARKVAQVAAQQAKAQVEDRVALEKSSVVRQVMGVAEALRATAEQFDGVEQGAFAGYAHRAADVAERLGDAIERKTLSDIMADVERVSREQPLVAGAVAAAVGFVAARMARSAFDAGEQDLEPQPARRPRQQAREVD